MTDLNHPVSQENLSVLAYSPDRVRIERVRALHGPNLYAYMPVLHIVMDIGEYDDYGSDSFPGFVERLTAWLPDLQSHECSVGHPGGFIERLRRGTYLAHITEHVTIALQNLMGYDVRFGRARGTGRPGVYQVVIAFRDEEPAQQAFETALRLTLAAMHDLPFDHIAEIEKLRDLADEYRLGPSTAAIVAAARAHNVPVMRLTEKDSLVQLGYGIHQKRIMASETSFTSAIAVTLCQEKALTNRMLSAVGVPVPDGRIVESAEDAWEAAQQIGLPVVVKPEDGNQGKGVSVNLNTQAEVVHAYEIARQESRHNVLVERFIEGSDYRLLVIDGVLVAAARRDPAQVVGDGVHNITELVEIVNQDPRRREGHGSVLTRITINEAAELVLRQQGYNPENVPPPEQVVRLRSNSNLSTGGTSTDVTDTVHPHTARIAELAAQILSLDVAGIDIVCRDITLPLSEQGGAIVEVNAAPGLRMHLHPASGQPRDVGTPIVNMLFPPGNPSRIPIIAVTGTNGKTTVTRLISHMYETAHHVVGMTSTEGTFIGEDRILEGDCSGPKSARAVLLHPHVEVAVLETARGGILREGLAFDRCTVGVVTNISPDHLGLGGVETLQELAHVKQVVVESVLNDGTAVLNADDPLVAEMAAATDARVVYFSMHADNHIVRAHLAEGGSAVIVVQGNIILAQGDLHVPLIELERVEFTHSGKVGFQVQNALAAAAAAWSAGLNPALIARALSTFKANSAMNPGRFNISHIAGVEVILDYGHNAAAIRSLSDALNALDKRRTVWVFTLPGDRRNEDILETTEAAVSAADEFVLYDSDDLRGRGQDELSRLMYTRVPREIPCAFAFGQKEAVRIGWDLVKPGDRLVLTVDDSEDAYNVLDNIIELRGSTSECDLSRKPTFSADAMSKKFSPLRPANGKDRTS